MGIFTGLAKIALSPLKGVSEVIDDIKGDNGESSQGASILSVGISSVIKGTAKGIKKGTDEIFK